MPVRYVSCEARRSGFKGATAHDMAPGEGPTGNHPDRVIRLHPMKTQYRHVSVSLSASAPSRNMVRVPGGEFLMGSPMTEVEREGGLEGCRVVIVPGPDVAFTAPAAGTVYFQHCIVVL